MIIPSLDLSQGKAVQLKQGRQKMLEVDRPLELARKFSQFGPLAVIDLDEALETGSNEELIGKICQVAECRVGGGIRNLDKARRIFELGAEKIIIGTAAWQENRLNRDFLYRLSETFGRWRIILALDCYQEKVVIKGWQEETGVSIFSVLDEASRYASEFLVTCVEKEGGLRGTDLPFFEKLRAATSLPLTAAGGISSLEEISALSQLNIDVQLGMAIYSGKIGLEEAFAASLNWEKGTSGLLPAVVVDELGRLLMLAWVSPESLQTSFKTGKTCFFSRSRKTLWSKGETSGNEQKILRLRTDCDGDTVLFVVKQEGSSACHKGNYSCFGAKEFRLEDLYQVVRERIRNPRPESYTASLGHRSVREKLQEEAVELTEAKSRDEIIWEAADLLYFTTVLLAREGVKFQEVLRELQRRRRKKRALKVKL
ncbi:MAG: bifunctional phosphoribosyl-AMP cyclohydrolase/phosphoribosyl-ATP diphosphatase HisIE [Candidatus Aminicenantes bacterium]|nr:bifunctional phosphoribosyl-AMP cyclohydrolase/phosphoribosyl-ATP diphosphatase HisIE [Candidatus Aminicenantes bacterium]